MFLTGCTLMDVLQAPPDVQAYLVRKAELLQGQHLLLHQQQKCLRSAGQDMLLLDLAAVMVAVKVGAFLELQLHLQHRLARCPSSRSRPGLHTIVLASRVAHVCCKPAGLPCALAKGGCSVAHEACCVCLVLKKQTMLSVCTAGSMTASKSSSGETGSPASLAASSNPAK